jgi:pimeloyl-ACP methyl ester carboxylesterase
MAPQTYEMTPTRFVEANNIRYAYRSFGKEAGVPLVFLQHFRGTLDNWDPAVVNGLAKNQPVVLFDSAGIGRSGGETPDNVAEMVRHAVAVIKALGLTQVDLLGFSLGGFVAQQVTLDRPDLVRRVILAGTGPQGGEGMDKYSPEVQAIAAQERSKPENLLFLFFAPTETSQAAGRAFLGRLGVRKEDREPPSNDQVRRAQLVAIQAWGRPQGERYARLREIKHPVLVVNGNNDVMIPTINSYILAQHLPNAQLILYPDSGHGALFQYPELFVEHASLFLRG